MGSFRCGATKCWNNIPIPITAAESPKFTRFYTKTKIVSAYIPISKASGKSDT